MNLRGLANATVLDSNVTSVNDGDIAGKVIVGIFLFIIMCCVIKSCRNGGCDSGDTAEAAQHRARCRMAARGQGPYAL